MSEPIKRGQIDQAPTPQNTPASVSGSYLTKTQAPAIPSTIMEDEELRQKLLTNPLLLSAIEGKLNTLIGQDSGYVEKLPKNVKNRVYGLKSLQKEQFKLEAEFQQELLELERKFHGKFAPLYVKRGEIVVGKHEPDEEQIEEGKKLMELEKGEEDEGEEEEEEDDDKETPEEEAAEAEGTTKGIPGFWLTAFENLGPVSDLITDRDADVLTSLKDIRMSYLDIPGFKLTFEFEDNAYFTDKTLTKMYYYQKELGYTGDFIYDHAQGCTINWKDTEHNVTISVEKRKQRNKHTKQVRTIEKLTPVASLFNFFDPPVPPKPEDIEKKENEDEDEDDEEDEEKKEEQGKGTEEEGELEQRLQMDYEIGELIKDKLIPRAVDWFTGDALQYEFDAGEDFDEDGEEDEEIKDEDEEEEGENDDDDDDDDDEGNQNVSKAQPADCNQQ
ncbi:hypothetical protein FOA43_001628 [Brettanomyces nanus]|uniref:Nucleosome assembly protein n=1 Tax=Eeniella nana TaxID=13502 RepID=A0A875S2J7_EENNA|nr:uncharacterized protein FOA43_001628 [Brettanomyces nanus]QPG74302.1 hypothetical protein FOA43_001628 [Brettanomyces nanus]